MLKIVTLFVMFKEQEHELKRLNLSERCSKKKENNNIEDRKKNLSKALNFQDSTFLEYDEDDLSEDSSKKEEICLFIKRYNHYLRKNKT